MVIRTGGQEGKGSKRWSINVYTYQEFTTMESRIKTKIPSDKKGDVNETRLRKKKLVK